MFDSAMSSSSVGARLDHSRQAMAEHQRGVGEAEGESEMVIGDW